MGRALDLPGPQLVKAEPLPPKASRDELWPWPFCVSMKTRALGLFLYVSRNQEQYSENPAACPL